jgi:hypothetical protein
VFAASCPHPTSITRVATSAEIVLHPIARVYHRAGCYPRPVRDHAPSPRTLLAVDAALLSLLTALAWALWGSAAPHADVSGDAFMALQCGWATLQGERFAEPTNLPYGYALGWMTAPLLLGADSLQAAALRGELVVALVVPLTYLCVLWTAPTVAPLGPWAVRVGAVAAALLIWRNDSLGWTLARGGHTYFAAPLVGLAFACWARGLARRAPVAVVLGLWAVPLAMMNHPFTAWLVPVVLVLTPALWRSSGPLALALGYGGAVALAIPRLQSLVVASRETSGDALRTAMDTSFGEATGMQLAALGDLAHSSNLALGFGLLILAVLPVIARDPAQRPRQALWLATLLTAAVAMGLLMWRLSYATHYHVVLMFPLGALGIGVGGGLAWRYLCRPDPATATGAATRPGKAEGTSRNTSLTAGIGVPIGILLLAGGVEGPLPAWPSDLHIGLRSSSAAGSELFAEAITDDLEAIGASTRPVLVTNVLPGRTHADSAAPVVLDLLLRGEHADRLHCCLDPDPAPIWYWIVDTRAWPGTIDDLGQAEDVEVLVEPDGTFEQLVAIHSAEGLAAVSAALCAVVPPDEPVTVSGYAEARTLFAAARTDPYAWPDEQLPACFGADSPERHALVASAASAREDDGAVGGDDLAAYETTAADLYADKPPPTPAVPVPDLTALADALAREAAAYEPPTPEPVEEETPTPPEPPPAEPPPPEQPWDWGPFLDEISGAAR